MKISMNISMNGSSFDMLSIFMVIGNNYGTNTHMKVQRSEDPHYTAWLVIESKKSGSESILSLYSIGFRIYSKLLRC